MVKFLLEDGVDHRLMDLASDLVPLLSLQTSWLKTVKKAMLNLLLFHWLSTIWNGFMLIGVKMDVIFGKRFIAMISFGIEWHTIIQWILVPNFSIKLGKVHMLQNAMLQKLQFKQLWIAIGLELLWLSQAIDKKMEL